MSGVNEKGTNVGKLSSGDIKALLQSSENEYTGYIEEIKRPKLDSVEANNYRDSLLCCIKESRSLYKKIEKTVQLAHQKFHRQSQALASAAETKIKTETDIIRQTLAKNFRKSSEDLKFETLKTQERLERQILEETIKAKAAIENCKRLVRERDNLFKRLLLSNHLLYNLYSSTNYTSIPNVLQLKQYINSDNHLKELDKQVNFTNLIEKKSDYSGILNDFDSATRKIINESNLVTSKSEQSTLDKIKYYLKYSNFRSSLLTIDCLPKKTKQALNSSEFGNSFKFFCQLDLTSRYFAAQLTNFDILNNTVEPSD